MRTHETYKKSSGSPTTIRIDYRSVNCAVVWLYYTCIPRRTARQAEALAPRAVLIFLKCLLSLCVCVRVYVVSGAATSAKALSKTATATTMKNPIDRKIHSLNV